MKHEMNCCFLHGYAVSLHYPHCTIVRKSHIIHTGSIKGAVIKRLPEKLRMYAPTKGNKEKKEDKGRKERNREKKRERERKGEKKREKREKRREKERKREKRREKERKGKKGEKN